MHLNQSDQHSHLDREIISFRNMRNTCICGLMCMPTRVVHIVHEQSVMETRQSKATTPEDNSPSSQEKKKSCLMWDSNP